jgi:TolB-like protein/DNA-binding winged helix-turn-helix (wHTH) protein
VDSQPACYVFGPYRLDPSRRALEVSGAPVALSSRAFDILQILIEAHARVVTREELMAYVWPGVNVEPSNLTVQMSTLRRALGDTGEEAKFIATVPGRGYRFIGHLDEEAPELEFSAVPAAARATVESIVAPSARTAPATRQRQALHAALAVTVLCAGAWMLLGHRGAPPGPPRLSIVVMPFRNLSDTPGKDYLADAIADDLTTDLAHIPGALVIARASSDVYKGREVPADQIGRALNVRYLLEGSVRAADSTVRINAQLIDTVTGTHVWSDRFDASTAKLWDAQTDIVHRIASALNVALVDAEVARAARERPNNPDALDLFNRARSIIDRANTLAEMTEAQRLLERAIKAEPDFVDALASLGWLLVLKEQGFEYPTAMQDDAEADRAIAHALALAPHNPAVLAARGRFLASSGQCAEARAAFDAALGTDPNNVEALWGEAYCAWRMGEPDKVARALQAAVRIDPQGPAMNRRTRLLGLAALFNGEPREALSNLLRAAAQEGDTPGQVESPTQAEMTRVYLIAAHALAGNLAEAQRAYRTYNAVWPHRTVWRQATLLTPAQSGVPQFRKVEGALVAAGMPRFADEHGDCVGTPSATPLQGGEFTPTPCGILGAHMVDTAAVTQLLASRPSPAIIDVGHGMAVIPGAVYLGDSDLPATRAALEAAPFASRLNAAGDAGIIVMDTGPAGVGGYNAALRLVAMGYPKIFWYRGGEEAWAQSGEPAEDRRGE